MQQNEKIIFSIMTIPTDLVIRYLNSYSISKKSYCLFSVSTKDYEGVNWVMLIVKKISRIGHGTELS